MRYPADETAEKHKKILSEASRLFREKGLSGVSVGELMKAADMTHGSFYNHFSSKHALIGDCINYVRGRAVSKIESFEPTLAGKGAFIEMYLGQSARDNPGSACLLSTMAPETAREPSARPAITHYVQTFIASLAARFPWSKPTRSRGDAIRLTASMVGALVLARAVDDPALSDEILQEIAKQYMQANSKTPE